MSDTPLLKLPEIAESQSNKFITHNEALRRLEVFAGGRLLSRSSGGPPGSPSDGDAYIVDSATGDWSSFSVDDVAYYHGGSWSAVTPFEGLGPLWVNDEDLEVIYDGGWIRPPINAPKYTVANLPTAGTAARMAYATDGRKNGETAGNGTGVLVFDDGNAWIAVDSGQAVEA